MTVDCVLRTRIGDWSLRQIVLTSGGSASTSTLIKADLNQAEAFPARFFACSRVRGPNNQLSGKKEELMNPFTQQKKSTPLFFVALLLACFALSPMARAVSPPPDGCYPMFNTAEGCNALLNVTSGAANTAVGWYSLWGVTDGNLNTAVGAGALTLNTADANTAVGAEALLLNETGTGNTAVGAGALVFNEANANTAVGAAALALNDSGFGNAALGTGALAFNTIGSGNTA